MINSFRIQNYKSIKDVTVHFTPLTVLIGKSGTGKSNFVQGMKYFRDLLIGKTSANSVNNAHKQSKSVFQRFEITLGINANTSDYVYTVEFEKQRGLIREEKLTLKGQYVFHHEHKDHSYKWLIKPNLHDVPNPNGVMLGKLTGIDATTIVYSAITQGIGYYLFDSMELLKLKPSDSNGSKVSDALPYDEILRNLSANMKMVNRKHDLTLAMQRINKDIDSFNANNVINVENIVISHNSSGGIVNIPIDQESDGFRRFCAYLFALNQPDSSLKQTLIFEEPENGIYQGALEMLANFFKGAAKQGLQVILTTHSPQLLDHFDTDSIQVVELEDMETKIGPLDPSQKEAIRDGLMYPGELLTVNEARIGA